MIFNTSICLRSFKHLSFCASVTLSIQSSCISAFSKFSLFTKSSLVCEPLLFNLRSQYCNKATNSWRIHCSRHTCSMYSNLYWLWPHFLWQHGFSLVRILLFDFSSLLRLCVSSSSRFPATRFSTRQSACSHFHRYCKTKTVRVFNSLTPVPPLFQQYPVSS